MSQKLVSMTSVPGCIRFFLKVIIEKAGCFFQTWGLVPLTDSVQVLACEGEEIWGTVKLEPGLKPANTRCSNVAIGGAGKPVW